ncbi:MAG: flagellar biosynthesis protein FliQ [Burkholderiales bacterium]
MTPQTVLTIGQQALEVMLMVSAPMLLAALMVGLVISVLQAATQINEMTLSFIPKLIAMVAVLVVAGPWMLSILVDYIRRLFESIPSVIG